MSESLNSILSSLPRRLNDLESFQLPRLKSCLGPLDLHKELIDEMKTDLDGIKYKLDMIKEISYSLTQSEQHEAYDKFHPLEQQYLLIKKEFRQAMLESKRNILSRRSRIHELAEKSKSRYELDESKLQEGNDDGKKSNKQALSAAEFGMGGDDELQTKTNEVTTALRRTTALMQTELEKSVLTIQTFESSSSTLLSTTSLYDRYSTLLDLSKSLVKSIEKADFLDKIIILSAFSFFLLVVAFIIKRRVLDKTVGFVFGGVFKALGWYFFGTLRLLRLILGGGRGSKEVSLGQLEKGLVSREGSPQIQSVKSQTSLSDSTAQTIEGNKIGKDSAIGGQEPKEQLYEYTPDPVPGSIPTQPFDLSKMSKAEGGEMNVEIIANDQDDRIKPSWMKDEL